MYEVKEKKVIYILDLDGTLIDSSKRHYVLMEKLWKELSKGTLSESISEAIPDTYSEFPSKAYMEYKAKGNSGKQFLIEKMHLQESSARQITKLWTEQIEQPDMILLDALYEDTVPFLEKIRKPGNQIIYLTARQNRELVTEQLKTLNLYEYADEVIVVEPKYAKQQKTEEVSRICEKYGYHTEEKLSKVPCTELKESIAIIGDTENEYELAEDLGLPVYILNRGFRSREYWQVRNVRSYADLMEILTVSLS